MNYQLIKVLIIEVMEAIDLENLIYYKRIKVSKDETCINILLSKENIASLINAYLMQCFLFLKLFYL